MLESVVSGAEDFNGPLELSFFMCDRIWKNSPLGQLLQN